MRLTKPNGVLLDIYTEYMLFLNAFVVKMGIKFSGGQHDAFFQLHLSTRHHLHFHNISSYAH